MGPGPRWQDRGELCRKTRFSGMAPRMARRRKSLGTEPFPLPPFAPVTGLGREGSETDAPGYPYVPRSSAHGNEFHPKSTSDAQRAAAQRFSTPSFARMCSTCVATVRRPIPRITAISGFVLPCATQ